MLEDFSVVGLGYFISGNLVEKSAERKAGHFEIELYTTSDGISFVDEQPYPHSKGNILIIKPGQVRQSIGAFECHFLHFDCTNPEFREKYLDALPQLMKNCDTMKFSELFNVLMDIRSRKQIGYELYITAKLMELIAALFSMSENYKATDSKLNQYEFNIYEAAKFMQNHFSQRLTLSDAAQVANLSPSYFHTVFKDIVGTTPHRYLLNIRLKTAQKLLLNSKKSLSAIAEECGFESQVYLNYIFKKELNTTPKRYRDTETITIL